MSRSSAALAACVALGLLACAPSPAAAPPAAAGRTILLLGGATFGGSDRVARTLDDIAAATDVLGDTRFVLEAPVVARAADLPGLLARHPEATVAIAIVGDLSVLEGIDPSATPQALGAFTHRDVERKELEEALLRLEQAARAQGTTLLLATAPLGRQARVEVPELGQVAALLRERGPVLDLEEALRQVEPAPLFANGLDRLDAFGHDELARALFALCCLEDGPLPPRDAAESSARLQARALLAYAADRREEFETLAAQVLAEPAPAPGTPAAARDAVRRAAIASALDGFAAHLARWEAIEGPTDGVPGLALGRELARAAAQAPPAEDPALPPPSEGAGCAAPAEGGSDLEASLVLVLDRLRHGDAIARELAERCVDAHPERLEAWIGLQVVTLALPPHGDVRPQIRAELALFPRSAVAPGLVERLLTRWPAPVDNLPALLLAARPSERLAPTGPLLETARRRAALGFMEHALELLRDGLGNLRTPPGWQREMERIAALPPS